MYSASSSLPFFCLVACPVVLVGFQVERSHLATQPMGPYLGRLVLCLFGLNRCNSAGYGAVSTVCFALLLRSTYIACRGSLGGS